MSSGGGGRGGALRGLVALPAIALWAFAGAGVVALVALLLGRARVRTVHRLVRAWGRVPLALAGVRLDVHGAARLAAPGPKIALFNHVSLLDLFVVAALIPERPMVLYKAELDRVPLIGWGLRAVGFVAVERQDHARAVASVTEAGRRIAAERGTLVVAPEGTRSRRGGLQEFKLGAFHLAAAHGLPVVPVVLRGIERVLPMGAVVPRPGVVRVDVLSPVDTRGWSVEGVRAHAAEVRARFLELVPPAPPPDGA